MTDIIFPTLPFRVLGIDPAISNSGWCIVDVISWKPLKIKIIARGQIDGSKLAREYNTRSKLFKMQYCIVEALEEKYKDLIKEYSPNVVVSEGAFGHLHLAVLVSLTLVINAVRRASKHILGVDIFTIAPRLTKRAFADNGNADKDMMRKCYIHSPFIVNINDSEISEHEIDSIAHVVGYLRSEITKEIVFESSADKRKKKREKEKAKLQKDGAVNE